MFGLWILKKKKRKEKKPGFPPSLCSVSMGKKKKRFRMVAHTDVFFISLSQKTTPIFN